MGRTKSEPWMVMNSQTEEERDLSPEDKLTFFLELMTGISGLKETLPSVQLNGGESPANIVRSLADIVANMKVFSLPEAIDIMKNNQDQQVTHDRLQLTLEPLTTSCAVLLGISEAKPYGDSSVWFGGTYVHLHEVLVLTKSIIELTWNMVYIRDIDIIRSIMTSAEKEINEREKGLDTLRTRRWIQETVNRLISDSFDESRQFDLPQLNEVVWLNNLTMGHCMFAMAIAKQILDLGYYSAEFTEEHSKTCDDPFSPIPREATFDVPLYAGSLDPIKFAQRVKLIDTSESCFHTLKDYSTDVVLESLDTYEGIIHMGLEYLLSKGVNLKAIFTQAEEKKQDNNIAYYALIAVTVCSRMFETWKYQQSTASKDN